MSVSPLAFWLLIFCLSVYSVAAILLIKSKKTGYIALAFCIYHVFFLIIPAIFHVKENHFPFYGLSYESDLQAEAAFVLMLFSAFFFFGYALTRAVRDGVGVRSEAKISKTRFLFAIYGLIIFQVAMIAVFGVDPYMVARRDFSTAGFGDSSASGTLLISLSRSASFLTIFLGFYFRRSLSFISFFYLSLIGGGLFLIINYPLALSRYLFFSYILAFLYVLTRPSVLNKMILFFSFFIGATTVFPYFAHITRGDQGEFKLNLVEYYLTSGDFDGFQSLINIVKYTDDHFYTLGYQLLGAAMTFVPRGLWVDKPYATGQIAAENMGYDFTNISAPMVSEIFIDFGYVGVTIGAVFLGWLVKKLDSYSVASRVAMNHKGILLSALVFSFSLILLRGSLIGVIAVVSLEIIFAVSFLRFVITATPKMEV